MPSNRTNPKIYVSIVSHGHSRNIAEELKPHTWKTYSDVIIPVVLSNFYDNRLASYCNQHRVHLLNNDSPSGFGQNNNRIFDYAKETLALTPDDYFFCINPDVITNACDILKIAEIMQSKGYTVAAPNLIKPDGTPDDNIRTYPKLSDMVLRYLFNSQIGNNKMSSDFRDNISDWASGAFLCFKSSVFDLVQGFDERYFMYYEDADICRRAKAASHPTYYLQEITAIHIGNRKSRGLPTKQLFHHVTSALKFLIDKRR